MIRISMLALLTALVAACAEGKDFEEPRSLSAAEEAKPASSAEEMKSASDETPMQKPVGSVEDHVAFKFEKHDANKDGFITSDEAQACGHFSERFAKIDANGDGKVSREEMAGHMKERFESGDMPCMKAGEGDHGDCPCKGGDMPCMKAGGSVEERVAHKFEMKDMNKDGFITADEGKGCPWFSSQFTAIDTDSNGKITREELARFMADKPAAMQTPPEDQT